MKKHNFIFSLIFFFSFSFLIQAQELNIATYNLRNDANVDDVKNGNGWKQRLPHICDLIEYHDFDIFGTQEGLHHQLDDIKELLPNLDYIGVGRDDGKEAGEYSAIFYKKDKFELIDSGNFWLSENSKEPNLGWDAVCIRICSWGKFKEKSSGKEFFFFNLHTDHIGTEARREGAKLVLNQIKELSGNTPTILTGDFNVDQNDESYALINTSGLLKDSYELSAIKYANNGTYNDFDPNLKTNSRIDHIFLTNNFKVKRYAVITDFYWSENDNTMDTVYTGNSPKEISLHKNLARIPSDHYPVVIEAEL